MRSASSTASRTAMAAGVAFDALRKVTGEDAYANLVLPPLLTERGITARDAAFATELLNGTFRWLGTYDAILEAASGRALSTLQPAVVDLLRLGTHQVLGMRVGTHAAVSETVDLAGATVGRRVTGLVNAVLRRVAAHDRSEWVARLGAEPAAIETLSPLAEQGAPTAAALRDRWNAVQGDVLSAVRPTEPGSALERFAANARNLVQVRRVGAVQGDDPAALVSQIDAALASGDVQGALATWSRLPQAGQYRSRDWAAAARSRARSTSRT